jgi:ribonuclease HI
MTNWINKWMKNGWLKSDGTPLKHKHYYQELLDLIDNFKVNWVTNNNFLSSWEFSFITENFL